MRILQELSQVNPSGDTVLTIGVFDGVHRGHQYLLGKAIAHAAERGLHSSVVTFANNPKVVLRPGTEFYYLNSLNERIELIRETGIETVAPLTFDLDLSKLTAREFVQLLQQHLKMRGIVVGPDFALGHNREGTPQVLEALCKELGFTIDQVSVITNNESAISSTVIRQELAKGAIDSVNNMLGRNFSLKDFVQRGDGRGRDLGFPTANLIFPEDRGLPADGIYATWAHLANKKYPSATSIGTRPTFGNGKRVVEAFLIDFSGDIYNQELEIEFVQYIRPEERFDSTKALINQMALDVKRVRSILDQGNV